MGIKIIQTGFLGIKIKKDENMVLVGLINDFSGTYFFLIIQKTSEKKGES